MRRLLTLYRPFYGWMALGILVSLATLLANVTLMAVSGWFITSMAIAGAAQVSMNYFTPAAIIRGAAIVRTGGRYLERLVQTALQQLPAGRTVIVIAHRLNTVRSADRILLLQDGRIMAQGSHAQLLRDSATYRHLAADFGDSA